MGRAIWRAGSILVLAMSFGVAQSPLFRDFGSDFPAGPHPVTEGGDLDGDGDYDFIFFVGAGNYRVLLNDGTGRFAYGPEAAHGASAYITDLGFGDFDDDGDTDVAIVSCDVNYANWRVDFLQNSNGLTPLAGFALPPTLYSDGNVLVLDYDGDGDADLLLSGTFSTGKLCLNQGNWGFTVTAGTLPTLTSSPELRNAGDLDGDGDDDVLWTDTADAIVRVLRSDPGASTSVALYNSGPGMSGGAAGDYDGDGTTDLSFEPYDQSSGTPQNRLVVSFSGLTSTVLYTVPMPNRARSAKALDVDGDGIDELVVAHAKSIDFYAANSAVPSFSAPGSGADVGTIGDMDADGDPDVVFFSLGYRWRILFNQGDGGFVDIPEQFSTGFEAGGLGISMLLDCDGDGAADIVAPSWSSSNGTASPATSTLCASFNDGRGAFSATLSPGGGGPDPIYPPTAIGDFNNDGFNDFAHFNQSALLVVRSGDGTGSFTKSTNQLSGYILELVAADLNGDALPELVVLRRSGTTGTILVLTNQVSAFSGAVALFTASSINGPPLDDFAVFDADQDGDLDLVTAGAAGAFLLVNDGFGNFAISSPFVLNFGTGRRMVTAGDVDGDNILDVLIGWKVFLGVSGGGFVPSTLIQWAPMTGRTRLVDLNGDGWADILGNNSWRPAFGGATFGPEEAIAPMRNDIPAANGFWQINDIDGDGDLDLWDSSKAFRTNLYRQLSWGAPAALGRTGSLALYGASNAPFLLAASLPTAAPPTPLGVWGLFRLDLASTAVVAVGNLDAAGTTEVSVALPNVLALEGIQLLWQAAYPFEQRLTGAISTTIVRL